MRVTTFWGREKELGRLHQFLDQAKAGVGQVVFVAGEAGAGKSALVHEFVRRSEEADTKLVAAIGQCNAYTGAGDPYLPFRQLLTLLTGADAVVQSGNAVTVTNAARLREFARISGETLVDVAPDLIGIFVPGASLLAKIVSKAMQSSKLTDKLAQKLEKLEKSKADAPPTPTLDQEKIFEQYAKALQALSREHTLILMLDDLQWADNASLNLLFYLARQLHNSRVLLVGAYRPGDVALGRGSDRHPFEQVLNELRRYHGDIVIDLDETLGREGREFIDAVIDSEPNRLDEAFHRELFARTGGHPLFTIELLRNLQERGGLVQDATGRWSKDETLDWETLPARVEGVIEERINRLTDDLRETLSIGSVMGINFITQVVGRVQQIEERVLLKNLARELDKRHHLVQEVGESRVGKQILTTYRFTHALVQQFIYDELSAGERRVMHGDVAAEMELLYEGHTDAIAGQLAQHYQEAGDDEKAIVYLIRAGDLAFLAYALQEAIAHYSRALEMAVPSNLMTAQLLQLYTRRGRAYELVGALETALGNYAEMEQLARTRGDRALELEALLLRATLLSMGSRVWDPNQAQALSLQAQALARDLDERKAEARINWILMIVNRLSQGEFSKALEYGEQSILLARDLDLREQLALSLKDIVLVYWRSGQLKQAQQAAEEAELLWEQLHNQPMLAEAIGFAAMVYLEQGELERSRRAAEEGYLLHKVLDDRFGLVYSASGLAFINLQLGQLDQYSTLMAEHYQAAKELNVPLVLANLPLLVSTDRVLLGDLPDSLDLAQQALTQSEQITPDMLVQPKAVLVRLYLRQGNLVAAQAVFGDLLLTSFSDCLMMVHGPQSAVTVLLAHAELALAQGDSARALQIADKLAVDVQRIGAKFALLEVLQFRAIALRDQQRKDEAYAVLTQARQLAEAMSSRWRLWPILAALGELETERGNAIQAEEWRTQARAIVDTLAQTLPLEWRAKFLNTPLVQSVQKKNL